MNKIISDVKMKYDNEVVNSLAELIEDTDLGSEESFEFITQLSFWLYIFDDRALALNLVRTITDVPYDPKNDSWDWVMYALVLESRILIENGNFEGSEQKISQIKESFNSADEWEKEKKIKTLKRRLEGSLLYDAKIEAAVQRGDLESEIDWRFVHFCELCFISAMGGSDAFSKKKLETEIAQNKDILSRNPIVSY